MALENALVGRHNVENTLAALAFAGTVRYRVPWDFLLALLAGYAVLWLLGRRRARAPS